MSWRQQLAQCSQQISEAWVVLEAGWWAHHIFVDLALAVDDHFLCSNQTIQTVHARACRGNNQSETGRQDRILHIGINKTQMLTNMSVTNTSCN